MFETANKDTPGNTCIPEVETRIEKKSSGTAMIAPPDRSDSGVTEVITAADGDEDPSESAASDMIIAAADGEQQQQQQSSTGMRQVQKVRGLTIYVGPVVKKSKSPASKKSTQPLDGGPVIKKSKSPGAKLIDQTLFTSVSSKPLSQNTPDTSMNELFKTFELPVLPNVERPSDLYQFPIPIPLATRPSSLAPRTVPSGEYFIPPLPPRTVPTSLSDVSLRYP